MSWNPVAALNPPVFDVPEGEPAPLMAAASVMSSIADDVRTRADAALSGFNAITGWEGPGQTAAAAMAADVVSTLHLAAGVVDAGASITRELASQIAEAKSEVNSAQNRAIELANWAATLVNPVYGLFDQVSGQAIGANDRARAAKEQAARRYGDLVEAAPHYVPPPPPPESKNAERGWFSKIGHGVLDVAGMVPVIGEPADLANAVWYEAEGDHLNAALSAASAIPLAGWAAQGAKWGKRGFDAIGAARGARSADEVVDAGRLADDFAATYPLGGIPLAGGAHRVPPVTRPADVPRRLPERQPQTPDRVRIDEPDPPVRRPDRNPTRYDPTPVEPGSRTFADAVRGRAAQNVAAQRETQNVAARQRAAWREGPDGQPLVRTYEDANAVHVANGWQPAHSGVWTIRDYRTTEPQHFVRIVFAGSESKGSFLARAEDLRGLSESGIRNLLALPRLKGQGAMHIVDVTVPARMPMRESVVRPIVDAPTVHPDGTFGRSDWGYGDIVRGNQFQVMGDLDAVVYSNRRPLVGTFQ